MRSHSLKRDASHRGAIEPLEARRMFAGTSGGFIPGAGVLAGIVTITPHGAADIRSFNRTHPEPGVIGLRSADARSNGVVTWHPS